MILRLEDIPPEGLSVEFQLDPQDPALEAFEVDRPLSAQFGIKRVGPQVLVSGTVRCTIHMTCSRCLEDYPQQIDERVSIELRPFSFLGDREEIELSTDDLDVEFFKGDSLDLAHLLAEQLSLALPMKPLCSAECGGLCPICGQDRKSELCSCGEEDTDPRWDALRSLKK